MNASLTERPGEYEFFQAVRLLELAAAQGREKEAKPVGGDALPAAETVRFRVLPSLGFAPGAVRDVRPGTDERPTEMRVTFFGLTGPAGVLPHHYTELALERLHLKDPALPEFLDLLHHRAISLYYCAWRKYRMPFAFEHAARSKSRPDPFTRVLASLTGRGTPHLGADRRPALRPWLYFAGLFSSRRRTAAGLEGLLSEVLALPVEVESLVGRWLEIEPSDRSRLGRREGRHNTLGRGLVLGARVWDVQSRIRVRVGPMDLPRYLALLPGRPDARRVRDLIRSYVDATLDFDLELVLRPEQAPDARLGLSGPRGPRLGRTAWLKPRRPGGARSSVSFALERH